MEKNTIYNLISHKAIEWLTIEKESPQSIVGNLFQTIEKQNRLRIPQKEAIRNYLWIKFVGRRFKTFLSIVLFTIQVFLGDNSLRFNL